MLFLGIISWNGASRFNGAAVFQIGGFIFKLGGSTPWGEIGFDGWISKRNLRMGGHPPMAPQCETLKGIQCSACIAFMKGKLFLKERQLCLQM